MAVFSRLQKFLELSSSARSNAPRKKVIWNVSTEVHELLKEARSMKIGIMSDSHDNMNNVKKAVEIFNEHGVERVLHAGDIIAPFVTRPLKDLNCPVVAVYGNNDGEKFYLKKKFEEESKVGTIQEPPVEMELGGKRIYLTHWPHHIEILARSAVFDVVVYGHTHHIDIRKVGETLIINPGEAGGWLREKATVVVLDLETLEPELVQLV